MWDAFFDESAGGQGGYKSTADVLRFEAMLIESTMVEYLSKLGLDPSLTLYEIGEATGVILEEIKIAEFAKNLGYHKITAERI